MTAIYRISQPGITGGKPPVGTWGIARADLDLFGDGGVVNLEAQDAMLSYQWELISEPEGSAISITNPTLQNASINILITGGYIFRLTVDNGQPTKDILDLYVGVPLPNSQLPIPALNETVQDNTDVVLGWERKLTEFFKWIDNLKGGVYEEPSGTTLSTRRIDSGATITGDYNFSSGALNVLSDGTSYGFIYGGSVVEAWKNNMVNTTHGVIFGRRNTLEVGDYTFINGFDNHIWGDFCSCLGYINFIGSSTNQVSQSVVIGLDHRIFTNDTYAIGAVHQSAEDEGTGSTLLGELAWARWPGSLYHSQTFALNLGGGPGLGQFVVTHLARTTGDASWAVMTLISQGIISTLDMADTGIYLCECRIIARTIDETSNPSELKTWVLRFTAHRDFDGNAVYFAGDKVVLASTAVVNEATWDVDAQVNNVPTATPMEVRVKGEAGLAIYWYCTMQTTQYEYTDPVVLDGEWP